MNVGVGRVEDVAGERATDSRWILEYGGGDGAGIDDVALGEE